MPEVTADVINGVKMMPYFCKGCNEIFAVPARRGRPPVLCPGCSGEGRNTGYDAERAAALKAAADARIDRLEMALRGNGTHISQHRDKW